MLTWIPFLLIKSKTHHSFSVENSPFSNSHGFVWNRGNLLWSLVAYIILYQSCRICFPDSRMPSPCGKSWTCERCGTLVASAYPMWQNFHLDVGEPPGPWGSSQRLPRWSRTKKTNMGIPAMIEGPTLKWNMEHAESWLKPKWLDASSLASVQWVPSVPTDTSTMVQPD